MSENRDAIRQICTDIAKRVDRAYMAEQGRKGEPAAKLLDLWVETGLLGIALPRIALFPWEASAPIKLAIALARAKHS